MQFLFAFSNYYSHFHQQIIVLTDMRIFRERGNGNEFWCSPVQVECLEEGYFLNQTEAGIQMELLRRLESFNDIMQCLDTGTGQRVQQAHLFCQYTFIYDMIILSTFLLFIIPSSSFPFSIGTFLSCKAKLFFTCLCNQKGYFKFKAIKLSQPE